jgi:hypothetical protein
MVVECKELEEELEELVLDEEEEVEVDSDLPLVDLAIQIFEAILVTTVATGLTIRLSVRVNSPNYHNACHGSRSDPISVVLS